MATLCSHAAEVKFPNREDLSERITPKVSGMQRMLSWATVLTAEIVVRMDADDRVEGELAKFGVPSTSD